METVSLREAYQIRKWVRHDLAAPRPIRTKLDEDSDTRPAIYQTESGEFRVAPPVSSLKAYFRRAKKRLELEMKRRQFEFDHENFE
uniref:Excisionase n=1 Tax=Rhabditophanes sp. KR3021 TaxID=114890 RepID=A0AC35TL79_9BILA